MIDIKKILQKILKPSDPNKYLTKLLDEENETLKEKLNFYVNCYFDNKERWEYVSDLLANSTYKQNIDDFFLSLVGSVQKCTSHQNIYFVIYRKGNSNKIYLMGPETEFLNSNKKHLENMKYDEITKIENLISDPNIEICPINSQEKEYGYLIVSNKNKAHLESSLDFIKVLCQYVSQIIKQHENNLDFEADNKSKIQFLINFSHEIKTPLNGIIIYSELLKNEEKDLNEDAKKYIKNINTSARHLNYLMTDITESAKTQYTQLKINKEKFFTNTEILNILSVFHSQIIEKNLKIETILTDVEMYSDIAKFNQILYNLISNAIKFSPKNGQVTLSCWVENACFNFEIKDEGSGIDEKERNKIFKFLSQGNSNNQKDGSGVGLAVTKKIIEIQGGKIGYISETGNGTTFWFKLPLDDGL